LGSFEVIVLDTHIWIWWVDDNKRLTQQHREWIATHQSSGLGVSVISCWEVAKLVEKNRLVLSCSVEYWLNTALAYLGVQLLPLSVPIIVQSTQLRGFHSDPADQIIVATAKVYNFPLLTADTKILAYPDVETLN
jgi:PIN domain nuclease of toxin-antitoxin system